MNIHATFVNYKYDPDVVELAHAWDEYSVDNNPEGYEGSLREELATYQGETLNTVSVIIQIDEVALHELLNPTPPKLAGKLIQL